MKKKLIKIIKKAGKILIGPFQDRKKFMQTLCKKAAVPYFRFHPLRHAGASFMDSLKIPLASIQNILGHECRRTTEIYIHASCDDSKRIMKIYEDARNFDSK